MRFLKKKIERAIELSKGKLDIKEEFEESITIKIEPQLADIIAIKPDVLQPKTRKRIEGDRCTSEKIRSTKNVVKNYGKAICSFAISELAIIYLEPMIQKEGVSIEDFVDFVQNIKETIDSIQTFRAVLMISDDDSAFVKAFKRIFVLIGEVFIKYFSVNWIFSGRITHKEAHLKFRFKMLRRIKSPENFVSIQKLRKGSKSKSL